MQICIVGLGLIGGSMALSLKRGGHRVEGYNRTKSVTEYALSHGIIDAAATDFTGYDIVFIALPPEAAISFILSTPFKQGAIVSDICGVKGKIEDVVYGAHLPISYIGLHPMAGKEVSGIENACEDLFDSASMVITHGIYTDKSALNAVKSLVRDMGFKYIVECSAALHDKKIAYTSQLAHVVSNSYVNDPEIDGCLGFTGGSFQDMTRIAGVDEEVWASLYLDNAENLLEKCRNLINSLNGFVAALEQGRASGSSEPVKEYLSVGASAYRSGKAEGFTGDGIKVTRLK